MDRKHLFDIHFFYNNISSYFFMTNQNDYHLKYPIFKGADMTEKLMARLQQAMDHNPEDIEQMKKNGHAAVGYYCLYSPMEIAVAAEATDVLIWHEGRRQEDAAQKRGLVDDPLAAFQVLIPTACITLVIGLLDFQIAESSTGY